MELKGHKRLNVFPECETEVKEWWKRKEGKVIADHKSVDRKRRKGVSREKEKKPLFPEQSR